MNKLEDNHTEDCAGGDECEPLEGQWNQPPGIWVNAAEDELGGAPMCRIFEKAWELQAEEEGE